MLVKRIGLTLVGLVIASGIAGCQPSAETNDEIIIGAVLPLTGEAATFGRNATRGAELAIAEANENAEDDLQFALITEDSRGNPAEAVSAARKLIEADGAVALIGDVTSGGTNAMIQLITEQEIPLISPSASDPALSGSSEFFARVWPSDVYEASVIADHAEDQGFQSIALIYANNDYGTAMADEFREQFGEAAIPTSIPVDRETLDYRPVIQRLKLGQADALMMVLYPEDALRFLQQMAEQELELPVLATATFEDPSLLAAPGAERVTFASPVPPSETDARRQSFVKRYQEKYGEDPGVLSDTGYDAAKLLIEAIQASGPGHPKEVMEFIKSTQDFPGVSGTMSFDSNGDVRKEYRLRTVRDGEFVWLESESEQGETRPEVA